MGTNTAATQPSNVPVQLTFRALNMYMAKRGKPAPARERRKLFAATAEAALCEKGKGIVSGGVWSFEWVGEWVDGTRDESGEWEEGRGRGERRGGDTYNIR